MLRVLVGVKYKQLHDMLGLKYINKIDYLSGMCCLIVLSAAAWAVEGHGSCL
jgi:hypothetical protein